MAASNSNRDVTLTLNLETLGQADVAKLQSSLQQLAQEGGDAAPQFEKLAAEIGKLGAQAEAIAVFKGLSEQVEQLAAKQQSTASTAAEMQSRLDALRASTAALQATEKSATDALTAGQLAFVAAGNAIRALRVDTDAAAKGTQDYRNQMSALVAMQNDARTALVTLRADQRTATSDTNDAEAALSKLATAYGRQSSAATKAAGALAAGETALAESVSAAEALGIATNDIATAEGQLVASYNTGVTAVRSYTAAQNEAAAALAEANWQAEAEQIVNAAEATAQLARETQIAAAAAQELVSQAAFEKAAADAQRLVQAGEYVQAFGQALNELDAQDAKTAQEAETSAQRIENAFKTLGGGSINQLEVQIAEVRAAMLTLEATGAATGAELASAFSVGNAKIAALEAQVRQLNGTMTLGEKTAGLFKDTMGQITAGNLIAQGVGFLVQKVKDLGVAFVESIVDLQKFDKAMNAIYKDTAVTTSQLQFLQQTAMASGVAVGEIQSSFVKFSASMKLANVPLQQSNDLFAALTRAGGTLGLSSEEVSGALEAMSQMAGKGVVQMEELRGQLGDRLPGALELAASGMGLTTGQLVKLVESGNLATKDFIVPFTDALKTMGGEATGLAAGYANLKTALTETAQAAGDSGWTQILSAGLHEVAALVGTIVLPLTAFGEVIFGVAKAVGVLVGAAATLTNPMAALNQIVDEAAARQSKLDAAFGRAATSAQAQTAATQQQTGAIAQLAPVISNLTTGVTAANESQQLLAIQTALAGDASLTAQGRHNQLIIAIDAMTKSLATAAVASETESKAVKANGDSLIAIAKLRGDEQGLLNATATASTNYAAAVQKSAAAHQAELNMLLSKKAELLADAAGRNVDKVAVDAQVSALDQLIVKAQASADQTAEQAAQNKAAALTAQIAAEAYTLTGERVALYKDQLDNAKLGVENMESAELVGLATKDQVRQTQDDLTRLTALYNVEVQKASVNIVNWANIESAANNIKIAGLQVQAQAITAEGAAAQASGRTATALLDQIAAIRLQMQIKALQAQSTKIAAQAEIDAVNNEVANGLNLTKQKLDELQVRKLNAQAKLIEAGASTQIIETMNKEILTIYDKIAASEQERNSTVGSTGTTSADTAARNANTDAINGQTTALQRQQSLNGGDTTEPGGFRTTGGSGTPIGFTNTGMFDLLAKVKSGTISADDSAELATVIATLQSNKQMLVDAQRANPAMVDPEALNSTNSALTQLTQAQQNLAAQTASGAAAANATSAPATAPAAVSTSHTVTINVGAKSATVGMASAADATNLADMLKQLEQASATAA